MDSLSSFERDLVSFLAPQFLLEKKYLKEVLSSPTQYLTYRWIVMFAGIKLSRIGGMLAAQFSLVTSKIPNISFPGS